MPIPEQEVFKKFLHDLATPVSVLLLLEDEMPKDANEAVAKIRQLIETYRRPTP